MRFCLVTTFFPPDNFGGDGVFVRRLARALARRGHTVAVVWDPAAFALLGGQPQPGEDDLSGEPNIELCPLGPAGTPPAALLLAHQLGHPVWRHRALATALRGPFDVIHFHNVSLLGGPGVLRYGRALKLCTLHDYWFVCAMHVLWRFDREACTRRTCLRCTLAGRRPPQPWRATRALHRAAARVDAFLAPSEFARQRHLTNGFPAPIRVLPHFLSTPDEAAPPTNERAEQPGATRPYFLYAGRLEKLKGVQDLIAAFRCFDGADLVIAGRGDHEPALRARAAGLGHVRFVGWQPRARLTRLYRDARAVVVPSRCYETFGLPPIEAFAVGTPAIVRRGGAAAEIVGDGDEAGGLLYDDQRGLLDALRQLADEPARRRALGRAGQRLFRQRYTEASHLRAYLGLIDRLQRRREAAA